MLIDLEMYRKEYTGVVEDSQFTLCDPRHPEDGLSVSLLPGVWDLTLEYDRHTWSLSKWKFKAQGDVTPSKVRRVEISTTSGFLGLVTPCFDWEDTVFALDECHDDDVFCGGDCLIISAGVHNTGEFIVDWDADGRVVSIFCKPGHRF